LGWPRCGRHQRYHREGGRYGVFVSISYHIGLQSREGATRERQGRNTLDSRPDPRDGVPSDLLDLGLLLGRPHRCAELRCCCWRSGFRKGKEDIKRRTTRCQQGAGVSLRLRGDGIVNRLAGERWRVWEERKVEREKGGRAKGKEKKGGEKRAYEDPRRRLDGE
jgi:hypothetical protein